MVRSFFIEVVFLRWGGVFRLKHHLKPKKAEIIGVVFRLGGVLKTPPGQIGVVFYVETPPRFVSRWCFQISGGVYINRALSVKVVAQMQMLESENIISSNSLIAMTTHEQVLQWAANIMFSSSLKLVESRAKELNIFDLRPFYKSSLFRNHGLILDEVNHVIIKRYQD